MKKNDFNYQPKNIEELKMLEKMKSKIKTDEVIRLVFLACVAAILVCLIISAFTERGDLVERALLVGGVLISPCFAYFAGKGAKND